MRKISNLPQDGFDNSVIELSLLWDQVEKDVWDFVSTELAEGDANVFIVIDFAPNDRVVLSPIERYCEEREMPTFKTKTALAYEIFDEICYRSSHLTLKDNLSTFTLRAVSVNDMWGGIT